MDLFKYKLDKAKQKERLDICTDCEHRIEITNICGKCLCYLPWKVELAPASCPDNRWTNITINNVVE